MKRILHICTGFLLGFTSLSALAEDGSEFKNIHTAFRYWFDQPYLANTSSIKILKFKNYKDLASYGLNDLFKQSSDGFVLDKVTNYSPLNGDQTMASRKRIRLDNGESYTQVVDGGYFFFHRGSDPKKNRLIAFIQSDYVDSTYQDVIQIFFRNEDLALAKQFRDSIESYVVKKNIYRNRVVEFVKGRFYRDYRIQFFDNVNSFTHHWADIILEPNLKKRAKFHSLDFLSAAEKFEQKKVKMKRGMILSGPPGTGKSFLGKVLISNILHDELKDRTTFIAVSARHFVYSDTVNRIFEVAKQLAPAVIFIEDIDLVGIRNRDEGLSSYEIRSQIQILNELLNGIDGVSDASGILIVGTTNQFESVDPALLRSKRLGVHLYFGLPQLEQRLEFFERFGKSKAVWSSEVNLNWLAGRAEGLSGADIIEIIGITKQIAFEKDSWQDDKLLLTENFFKQAFEHYHNSRSDSTPHPLTFDGSLQMDEGALPAQGKDSANSLYGSMMNLLQWEQKLEKP